MVSRHYGRNHTEDEISEVLGRIKDCIRWYRYTVAMNENREENLSLVRQYNLGTKRVRDILLKITPQDFCHSLQNTKAGFEHERLYVFCPRVSLYDICDTKQIVDIYIKFNIIGADPHSKVVVISFHKPNRPIVHLFR